MFHSVVERWKRWCNFMCVCLKNVLILYVSGKGLLSSHATIVFSGKWERFTHLLCANQHAVPIFILSLGRHFFRHGYGEGKMWW